MNPVKNYINSGLASWEKIGAKVTYLISETKKVPRIWHAGKSDKVVILASGLHMEETSGPILLLQPDFLIQSIKPVLDKGMGLLIYPVINQVGLKYLPSDNEHLLRYDEKGFNYNDGWGIQTDKKPEEVMFIEKDILEMRKEKDIVFAMSFHEDSEIPGKGYIYTNGISSQNQKKSMVKKIKSKVDNKLLATREDLIKADEPDFAGGKIEDMVVVEAIDKGGFEYWLADDLNIPTLLSEGPFGLDLETRIKFQSTIMESAISILANLP